MAEPRRLESDANDVATRDSQTEALLVDGLDRYFTGKYEDAIHLWTRVLFLDRTHARARAYIDRARTALAERQRRAEELLHASSDLIAQGHFDKARRLLNQASAATGDDERVAALRVQLERGERAHAPHVLPSSAVVDAVPLTVPSRARWSLWNGTTIAIGVGLVIAAVVLSPAIRSSLGFGNAAQAPPPATDGVSLTVLSSSQVALVRARTLYDRGRLAEALQALQRIDPESADRAAADELRVGIQRLLLASGRDASATVRQGSAGRQ